MIILLLYNKINKFQLDVFLVSRRIFPTDSKIKSREKVSYEYCLPLSLTYPSLVSLSFSWLANKSHRSCLLTYLSLSLSFLSLVVWLANKSHRSLMEFREKLLKFKFHIVFAFLFSLLIAALVTFSPGFLTVLSYFWPLFLSTALFLAAVFFFARTSDLQTSSTISSDGSGVKLAAEGILYYVVGGQQEETDLLDSFN